MGFFGKSVYLVNKFCCVRIHVFRSGPSGGGATALGVDDLEGQVYLLVVLGVAAAESALGLALLVQFYRLRGEVQTLSYPLVKA